MKIGLLSDTHSYFPEEILTHFADVDEIWHAGDIGNTAVADRIATFKPLRAVWGNIDGHELRASFPMDLLFEVEGLKVLITHIGGYPGKYVPRVKQLLEQEQPHLFICGHSHILKVIPDKKLNLLHLNPGAAGREGFHKVRTLMRFQVQLSKIQNLEVIELGFRANTNKPLS